MGEALFKVHFPIQTVQGAGKRGFKDPRLIKWMGANGLTWITKDDEAKREHFDDIIKSRINTVWVRGIDRVKNKVTIQQVHLMLTVKLPYMIRILEEARGPRHFILWLSGEKVVIEETPDIHRLVLKRAKRLRRP